MGGFNVIPPYIKGNSTSGLPNLVAYSEIGLTRGLDANGLDGGDLENVVAYLTQNLCWKIQKVCCLSSPTVLRRDGFANVRQLDGTVVPTEQLPGLVITAQSETVTLPSDLTELPVYGEKTFHSEITQGKTGGWNGSAA